MSVFKLIPLVLKWLPHVITAVSLIEVLASDTPGAEKKKAAMTWLENTSKKMNLPWGSQAATAVGNLVDTTVAIAKLVGYFKPAGGIAAPKPPKVAAADAAPALAEVDPDLDKFLSQGYKE